MTHEETKALAIARVESTAHAGCGLSCAEKRLLVMAQGYLALSVKWEEAQERFCVRCHHRWQGEKIEAPTSYCGDCHRECQALKAKWKETQAERDALKEEMSAAREACPSIRLQDNFDAPLLDLVQREVSRGFNRDAEIARLAGLLKASPGEIIKACPQCMSLFIESGKCHGCLATFTEPAYYQRVIGPVQP